MNASAMSTTIMNMNTGMSATAMNTIMNMAMSITTIITMMMRRRKANIVWTRF